jgi:hypothetical protein
VKPDGQLITGILYGILAALLAPHEGSAILVLTGAFIGTIVLDLLDYPLYFAFRGRQQLAEIVTSYREAGVAGAWQAFAFGWRHRLYQPMYLHNFVAILGLTVVLPILGLLSPILAAFGAAIALHIVLELEYEEREAGHVERWLRQMPLWFRESATRIRVLTLLPVIVFAVCSVEVLR